MIAKVYVIICPITGSPVYVGVTSVYIKDRIKQHWNSHNCELWDFIRDMHKLGYKTKYFVAKRSKSKDVCFIYEKVLIKKYTNDGFYLFNKPTGRVPFPINL